MWRWSCLWTEKSALAARRNRVERMIWRAVAIVIRRRYRCSVHLSSAPADPDVDDEGAIQRGHVQPGAVWPPQLQATCEMLETATHRILAEAYIDQKVRKDSPTQAEMRDFYARNPDLFERRRVYAFREFLFDRAQLSDAVLKQIERAKGPEAISTVLRNSGIQYRASDRTRPAETLPVEQLTRIAKMGRGAAMTLADTALANVLVLSDSVEQPITFERPGFRRT